MSDDEWELRQVRLPTGAHRSRSTDTPGADRELLFDDQNRNLGPSESVPIDEEELRRRYQGDPVIIYETAEGEADSTLGLGGALAGLALVGLTIGAVAAASAVSGRKERRREEEWQRAEARRNAAAAPPARASAPAGWYDIGAGRQQWWDGQGYPLGISGDDIPLECRILAIADAYDAMTSDRPYRSAVSHEEALRELRRCSGTQFDPFLVNLFCKADPRRWGKKVG